VGSLAPLLRLALDYSSATSDHELRSFFRGLRSHVHHPLAWRCTALLVSHVWTVSIADREV
jgi:hypothetical protein